MERVEMLREQAAIMRRLADSFDVPAIRAALPDLARRCEEMAVEMANHISRRLQREEPPSA